ncbi:hypothetical protein [Methylobacterium gnaphalii]|uniref:Uncharacterized protein n=1 Tax=Methylobacterium gnaphalii TaxID=1010610 RepID=A0A512JMW3_9HYPH|nr:hypothetical protein [Methylobacterium gnaphalii]GEP11284.1 hypothetical protein MGN01_31290 [Methylobacterium gnaphalii]GJD70138.1 hypothetical protein MMMDOFMJ_3080 [Methylobacterium gnaphalii]GLS49984.1 hypothetical protein GCM10007885_28360 [Methylobacterium gnaphalii]
MRDLDKALADIVAIRTQIARETAFRGLGSATLAATGIIAVATACLQAVLIDEPTTKPLLYFGAWIAAAALAFTLIGVETVRRSRRLHSGLADEMVTSAIESFLPAAGAGLCLALVFGRFAPGEVWMLPGLWQVLTGLGLFAAARILPKAVQLAGAWYLLAGLSVFALASGDHRLSPWLMGLPFAIGQAMLAVIMYRAMMRDQGGSDAAL